MWTGYMVQFLLDDWKLNELEVTMHCAKTIVLLTFLTLFSQDSLLLGQPVPAAEYVLTALRGEWEYHTFDKKWLLYFQSDTRLIYNKMLSTYSLQPTLLTIKLNDEQFTYRYRLSGDILQLTSDNGTTIRLKHKAGGDFEEQIRGQFFNYPDSFSKLLISFRSHNEFSVSRRYIDTTFVESVDGLMGKYRVEGNDIYLIFNDGTMDIAEIYDRDENKMPYSISFQNDIYEKDLPHEITPIILAFDPPPPPPPYPPPAPPPTHDPMPRPEIGHDNIPVDTPKGERRDDGSMLHDPSKNDTSNDHSGKNRR